MKIIELWDLHSMLSPCRNVTEELRAVVGGGRIRRLVFVKCLFQHEVTPEVSLFSTAKYQGTTQMILYKWSSVVTLLV